MFFSEAERIGLTRLASLFVQMAKLESWWSILPLMGTRCYNTSISCSNMLKNERTKRFRKDITLHLRFSLWILYFRQTCARPSFELEWPWMRSPRPYLWLSMSSLLLVNISSDNTLFHRMHLFKSLFSAHIIVFMADPRRRTNLHRPRFFIMDEQSAFDQSLCNRMRLLGTCERPSVKEILLCFFELPLPLIENELVLQVKDKVWKELQKGVDLFENCFCSGVDRHLLGLKQLALMRQKKYAGYVVPSLLTSNLYSRLSTSVLSTSNCGSKAVGVFCFGPVVPEGLGLGYVLHRDGMQIAISSFRDEANRFAELLNAVLIEMFQIVKSSPKSSL